MRAQRHGADHRLDEAQVFEAARPTVASHDFFHGAAKVDVDEFGRENVGDETRRVSHRLRVSAKYLDTDRTFVGTEAKLVEGSRVLPTDSLRGKKFGHDDVRAKAAT